MTEAKETSGASQTWKEAFNYDRYGNRTGKEKFVGQTQIVNDNKTHPTINPATNRFNTGQGYSYDKNGNLTDDAEGRTFVFNGENKQRFVVQNGQNVGEYFYDGEGNRVKKKVYETDGLTVKEETVFVYSAGKLVAEYSTKPLPTNPTTSYTVTDQLLSPRIITNSLGEVVSRRDFMPFGEEAINNIGERPTNLKYGATDSVRQKFTGYQKDEETGLDFAEARMYENRHGRFTAVDPLLASGKSASPQSFNRYVYVMNNPIIFTDPTGLQVGMENQPCSSNPCPNANSITTKRNSRGQGPEIRMIDNIAEVTVNGGSPETPFLAGSTSALNNSALSRPLLAPPTELVPTQMQNFLGGFPANPFEQAANGFVTGLKNVPIDLYNFANSSVRNFRTQQPLFPSIERYSCNNRIGCSWSTGTTGAAFTASGVVGGVFGGGAASYTIAPAPRIVFSGHGFWDGSALTTVPSGTNLTTYSPLGTGIRNSLGNAIETNTVPAGTWSQTFEAGSRIPDFTLSPINPAKVQGNPVTVTQPTKLSELLRPNMGDCHWAACSNIILPRPTNPQTMVIRPIN